MRTLLVLALFGIGTLLSLRGVGFAIGLFLWNNIFQPLWFAHNPLLFPAAHYVLGVLLFAYALHWARGKFRPKINFLHWYMVVFLAWIFVVTKVSTFPAKAVQGCTEIIKYVLPLLLISTCLRSIRDIKLVATVMVFSVGVWSSQAGVHGLIKGVSREMAIPGGQMTDNNDFMAATVSILPMLVYFIFSYQGKYRKYARIVCLVTLLLSICAIIFSNSRGSALGLAGTLLLYVTFVSKKKLRDGFAIFAVVGTVLLLLPETFWKRMSTIELSTQQTEGSAMERMMMMTYAYNAIWDYPLFGVGPDCWPDLAEQLCGLRLDPHNLWLKLTTEVGLPGLALYLGILGYTLYQLNRIRNRALKLRDLDHSGLSTALMVAIIGFLLPSTFLSHPFSEWLWAWLAIAHAFIMVYSEVAARVAGRSRLHRFRGPTAAASGGAGGADPGATGSGGAEAAPA